MTLGIHVMRKSVMPSIAKNVRSTSGRRRLATLAATVVLAGSVQLITAESSWACGDTRLGGPQAAASGPGVTEINPDAAFVSGKSSVAADGKWNEVAVKVTNKTGIDAHGVQPTFGIHTPGSGAALRTSDVHIQWLDYTNTWKDLASAPGCSNTVDADFTQRQRLDNGSSITFKFRYSLAPSTPKGVTKIQLVTDAFRPGGEANGATDMKTVNVTRAQTTPDTKPTTTAKPTAKPTTKPAPAKPVEDKTPAPTTPAPTATATKAPAATPTTTPTATPSAPATTAPVGTPELAHTGSSSSNGFLAATAAALVALGAGALIAVRRMRPQR
ncbi:LAETG motif-containing sortase-dependent surface protein [Kitasatospora sp. NPDC056181]|uniref:LAETG motif-containing sortase-dependent surface protein n=1 Tax=Kitasatospora sp. NPDC056181 TaxID=3345737 RepID=UPI0035DE9446